MTTEAQRRAKKEYRAREKAAGRYNRVIVEFYGADVELYQFIKSRKNAAGYIKQLVREDMGL